MTATASSSPRCNVIERRRVCAALSALLLALLAGCSDSTTERATLVSARPVSSAGGADLEVVQQLRLSQTMLGALDAGIPLQLMYEVVGCGGIAEVSRLELSYSALTRRYALRAGDSDQRYFSRRSALLAALDRIRLPLNDSSSLGCAGSVRVALDLAALPLPLRLPALLLPDEWRLTSPVQTWLAETA